jgi:hypothetical protein
MGLLVGLTTDFSGFTAAIGFGWGLAFAGALLTGAEAGEAVTGKGFTLLFATLALADLAAALLLLALAGTLTLLLGFVLAMTKAHQKGLNPS